MPNTLLGAGGTRTAAAAFVPSSISGLVLWLDATLGVTHSSNAVSQWADQSGNANHANQSTGAQKPTLGTDATTGLAKITFDGGDRMPVTDSASLDLTTGVSIFIACNNGTLTSFGYFLGKDNATTANAYYIYTNSGPTDIRVGIDGNASQIKTGGTLTGRHLISALYNKTNITGRFDRTTDGNTSYTTNITTNANDLYIGDSRSAGGFGYVGDMFEILIYNSGLGTTDRDNVETYLRDRWQTT